MIILTFLLLRKTDSKYKINKKELLFEIYFKKVQNSIKLVSVRMFQVFYSFQYPNFVFQYSLKYSVN